MPPLATLVSMRTTEGSGWLWSTANGHWTSAVQTKESCAFEAERHQRRGLRGVATEGTAFGIMAAARRPLRKEKKGAQGRSPVLECGTTAIVKLTIV